MKKLSLIRDSNPHIALGFPEVGVHDSWTIREDKWDEIDSVLWA